MHIVDIAVISNADINELRKKKKHFTRIGPRAFCLTAYNRGLIPRI